MQKWIAKLATMVAIVMIAGGCVPQKYASQRSGVIKLRVAEAVVVGFMAYQFHNDRFVAINRFGNHLARFGQNSDATSWVHHALLTASAAGIGGVGAKILGAPWQLGARDATRQASVFYTVREIRQVDHNNSIELDNVMDVVSPFGATWFTYYVSK